MFVNLLNRRVAGERQGLVADLLAIFSVSAVELFSFLERSQ